MSSELQQKLESMTLGQWQARQIVLAASIMTHFVESTPEDRLRWRPAVDEKSQTRSILEQVAECIYANIRFYNVFTSRPLPTPPASWDTLETAKEATDQLNATAKQLADVLEKLGPAELAQDYVTHRGPMPGALAMQFSMRNMVYHIGQINMIQLLYGDTEFHINADFLTL